MSSFHLLPLPAYFKRSVVIPVEKWLKLHPQGAENLSDPVPLIYHLHLPSNCPQGMMVFVVFTKSRLFPLAKATVYSNWRGNGQMGKTIFEIDHFSGLSFLKARLYKKVNAFIHDLYQTVQM